MRVVLAAFGFVLVTIALSAISAQHHGQVARELAKWVEFSGSRSSRLRLFASTTILMTGRFGVR